MKFTTRRHLPSVLGMLSVGGLVEWKLSERGLFSVMEHVVTEEGDLVIVALKGDLVLEYSASAREILLEAAGKGAGVVVDLSAVTMIDSSGVACLLEAFRSTRHRGKGFILASVDESVLRVIKLARLDTVFEIADDVEAARRGPDGGPGA